MSKTVPSPEQLRILVDGAERRRLTADEAAALRAGLAELTAARAESGPEPQMPLPDPSRPL